LEVIDKVLNLLNNLEFLCLLYNLLHFSITPYWNPQLWVHTILSFQMMKPPVKTATSSVALLSTMTMIRMTWTFLKVIPRSSL
jgi:hypothetical protein